MCKREQYTEAHKAVLASFFSAWVHFKPWGRLSMAVALGVRCVSECRQGGQACESILGGLPVIVSISSLCLYVHSFPDCSNHRIALFCGLRSWGKVSARLDKGRDSLLEDRCWQGP